MPNYDKKKQAGITAANTAELDRVRARYGGATPSGMNVNPAGRNNQEAVAFQTNAEDPLQSNLERQAERRENYYYGGSADYADKQTAAISGAQAASGARFGAVSANAARGAAAASASARAAAQRNPAAFIDANALLDAKASGNRQTDVYGGLMRAAQAQEGPSAAQAQLNLATSAAMTDQLALARSGRGMGGSAAGLRAARRNAATIQGTAANQSAIIRAQEDAVFRDRQLQAYGAAGGLASQQRAQDIGVGQYTSGVKQAGQTQADAVALGYDRLGVDYGQLDLGAAQGQSQADLGYFGAQGTVAAGVSGSNQNYEDNLRQRYTALATKQSAPSKSFAEQAAPYAAAGATLLASDIRAKKDIEPAQASNAFDMRSASGEEPPLPAGVVPSSIARDTYLPVRSEDVGKSREQLAREAAFDMRTWHGDGGGFPAGVVPATIGAPAPTFRREDVGKSREQLEASKALAKAPASSFKYKSAKSGPTDKTFTGPMAQDLARTPEGRTAVVEKPDGSLGVDTGRLTLLNASAFGEQQDEIERLKAEVAKLGGKKRTGS